MNIPVTSGDNVPVTVPVTVHKPGELTAADRCDRCGAQAYVRTLLDALDLLWCVHHFRLAEEGLTAAGATIAADNRTSLTARPCLTE